MIHHPLNGVLALADRPADHDHHQEPEEAGGRRSTRDIDRGRTKITELATQVASPRNKERSICKASTPKPILNTSLPAQFRQIRIELAREPGHPEGDTGFAYVIVAPLDADDRIDAKLWREHREACRITRLRPDQEDQHGHLVHRGRRLGVQLRAGMPDEVGFHFADERFVFGEYVSINEVGKMHTYRVVLVSHL